jgi:uncharacterized membrane protein required for colicin V production
MEHFSTVNPVDIVALMIICVNLIIGLSRGLSGELAGLVGTAAAFGLGIFFQTPFSSWLQDHTRLQGRSAQAVAFISTAIAVIIIAILLRLILRKIMKITFEPTVDKVGGLISGFIRSSILVLIIFVAVNMCPHEYLNRKFGEESMIGRLVIEHITPRLERSQKVEDLKTDAVSAIKDLDGGIKKR